LIQHGDVTIQRLVEAIKASRIWDEGRNAIVIVWDENDYSGLLNAPNGGFSSAEPKQRGTNGGIEPQGRKWREKRYALHQLLPVEIN